VRPRLASCVHECVRACVHEFSGPRFAFGSPVRHRRMPRRKKPHRAASCSRRGQRAGGSLRTWPRRSPPRSARRRSSHSSPAQSLRSFCAHSPQPRVLALPCLALPCLAQPLPLRLCEQMQRLGLSTAFRAHRDRFGALVRCGCTLRRLVESGQMNRPRGVQHRPRVRRNSDGL
jgi:hypothetical protein